MTSQNLVALAVARNEVASRQDRVAEAVKKLEATSEYRLVSACKENLERAREQEAEIRPLVEGEALASFDATQDKKGYAGATIKVVKSVEVSPDLAVDWAKREAPYLMILDTKTYIKGIKAGTLVGAPDELVEEYKVYIDKDLSRWLKTENDSIPF